MLNLPNPYTPSIEFAVYKQSAEDFIVNEQLTIEFTGQGEHLWLHLRKTNLNTAYVTKLLSDWAGIPVRDVGYSGLKDRHAVTTQWFSLRIPNKQPPAMSFEHFIENKLSTDEKIEVLETHWHGKKLNRGTHQGNEFILTLREVVGDKQAIEQQLLCVKQQGIPNYFGEQRFGQASQNIDSAVELFTDNTINGKKVNRKFDQDKISLYLSAARSELFNAILARRIEEDIWATPLLGDVMNLAGSNSIFVPEVIDDEMIQRLASGDIHLTAVMWGDGELKSFGKVAELEQAVIDSNPTYQILAQGLAKFGLKQQRRSLRLLPQNLSWRWLGETTLQLIFCLPTGSFATSLLATLIKPKNKEE